MRYSIDSGELDRIRLREDWRDRSLARVVRLLSLLVAGKSLEHPYTPADVAPPYFDDAKPATKTPEQLVKEVALRERLDAKRRARLDAKRQASPRRDR